MHDTEAIAVVSRKALRVPPPRRGRRATRLGLDALQVLHRLEVLPLISVLIPWAWLSQRRLPRQTRQGRPRRYPDAAIRVIALVAQLWQLSSREVCDWLVRWPALAHACGVPDGAVIHPAHFTRRLKQPGAYPVWLLYLALVWEAIRVGLIGGRAVILDSTLLAAWSRQDPAAAWSFPSPTKGRVFGYKVHTLLDRAARLPIFFLLSPANRNDLPFAYPLLALARVGFRLPPRVVRADGAYWGLALYRFIRFTLGAIPIIPFNRKKQPLAHVRHLVWWPVSYAARSLIERFFAVAKRYYGLSLADVTGWDAVLRHVTLTPCALLVVALAAHYAGRPDLRLPPSRVLAHYQPVEQVA